MIKIRTSLFIGFDPSNPWALLIKDDDGKLINAIAIPPTKGDRIDIYLEERLDDAMFLNNDGKPTYGICISHRYLYNFKGNIKKIKGEKIIINIKSGVATIKHNIK